MREPPISENRIEALAYHYQSRNKLNKLERHLETMATLSLDDDEKESWHHIYGICAYQRNDHEATMQRFKEGLKHCPEAQKIQFSLGQEYIHFNQPQQAFDCFDRCQFPEVYARYILQMSHYAYLYNEHACGMRYLKQFFPHYVTLKILDKHFLFYEATTVIIRYRQSA